MSLVSPRGTLSDSRISAHVHFARFNAIRTCRTITARATRSAQKTRNTQKTRNRNTQETRNARRAKTSYELRVTSFVRKCELALGEILPVERVRLAGWQAGKSYGADGDG